MSEKIVFFSPCRPQYADAVDIALRHNIVFIGYAAEKPGAKYRRGHLRDWLIDLTCSDEVWSSYYPRFSEEVRRYYAMNRNLVQAVGVGSITLIPRPDRGVIYAGRGA